MNTVELGKQAADDAREVQMWRRRGNRALVVGAVAWIVAVLGAGLAIVLGQITRSDLSPKVEAGSATCSGGNLAACDRVCISTAARLVIKTKDGALATVYCRRSRVTAQIGGTHTPAGLVVPGHTAPQNQPPVVTRPSTPTHQTPQNGSGGTPRPSPASPTIPALPPVRVPPVIPRPIPAQNCQVNVLGVEVCL